MDTRTETRCWRALAGALLLGSVLLGCGGGDDEPVPASPAPGAPPTAEAGAMQPVPAAAAAPAQRAAPQGVVSAAPCDRPAGPPHGAQAALHAEQWATEGEFSALTEAGRAQHAGTVPTDDPMADPAPTR